MLPAMLKIVPGKEKIVDEFKLSAKIAPKMTLNVGRISLAPSISVVVVAAAAATVAVAQQDGPSSSFRIFGLFGAEIFSLLVRKKNRPSFVQFFADCAMV